MNEISSLVFFIYMQIEGWSLKQERLKLLKLFKPYVGLQPGLKQKIEYKYVFPKRKITFIF